MIADLSDDDLFNFIDMDWDVLDVFEQVQGSGECYKDVAAPSFPSKCVNSLVPAQRPRRRRRSPYTTYFKNPSPASYRLRIGLDKLIRTPQVLVNAFNSGDLRAIHRYVEDTCESRFQLSTPHSAFQGRHHFASIFASMQHALPDCLLVTKSPELGDGFISMDFFFRGTKFGDESTYLMSKRECDALAATEAISGSSSSIGSGSDSETTNSDISACEQEEEKTIMRCKAKGLACSIDVKGTLIFNLNADRDLFTGVQFIWTVIGARSVEDFN